ncbi:protein prenylyltransferase [Westerdykella ornata]|uniref:Protein prenylyltransferase n=1 Tax=Westerdykella ornata TaxID=318751 RepID=A0A6A6JN60_WESOR|nr:protein prenylyltransferase [Westerdykella ornata]KAF2278070.1 protein prenylyltransferase [Westerdykella ornata]
MNEDSGDEIQKRAYNTLNEFFKHHSNEVVEIEILPPAFPTPDGILIQEGLNLGIHKKVLALAFLEARAIFFNGIKTGSMACTEALEASSVILLFDPEHITAANFRKRRLLEMAGNPLASKALGHAVDQELIFLNSILTSPLHRQSKSPTLWYHRTWLLQFLVPIKPEGIDGAALASFVLRELNAVCKASERHPKNYYAWLHARRLVAKVDGYDFIILESARKVQQWCLRNPGDVSGWSFLIFLLKRLRAVNEWNAIVNRTLDFAVNLGWEGEALWMFLRTALADNAAPDRRTLAMHRLRHYQSEREKAKNSTREDGQDFCRKAVEWIQRYSMT